jgi:hypothetical protein
LIANYNTNAIPNAISTHLRTGIVIPDLGIHLNPHELEEKDLIEKRKVDHAKAESFFQAANPPIWKKNYWDQYYRRQREVEDEENKHQALEFEIYQYSLSKSEVETRTQEIFNKLVLLTGRKMLRHKQIRESKNHEQEEGMLLRNLIKRYKVGNFQSNDASQQQQQQQQLGFGSQSTEALLKSKLPLALQNEAAKVGAFPGNVAAGAAVRTSEDEELDR